MRTKIHCLDFTSFLSFFLFGGGLRCFCSCVALSDGSGGSGNMRFRLTLVKEVKSINLRIGYFIINKKIESVQ